MKNNLYVISCADWTTVAKGVTAEQASTKAFEQMTEIMGSDLKVSGVVETLCLSEIMEDFDTDQYVEYCSCSKIMSNAGFHESAKMLKQILEK
tara:strand:- start:95 stop:373 length:279 start_codon:yes stop_codon:yes gene_type:complete